MVNENVEESIQQQNSVCSDATCVKQYGLKSNGSNSNERRFLLKGNKGYKLRRKAHIIG